MNSHPVGFYFVYGWRQLKCRRAGPFYLATALTIEEGITTALAAADRFVRLEVHDVREHAVVWVSDQAEAGAACGSRRAAPR